MIGGEWGAQEGVNASPRKAEPAVLRVSVVSEDGEVPLRAGSYILELNVEHTLNSGRYVRRMDPVVDPEWLDIFLSLELDEERRELHLKAVL